MKKMIFVFVFLFVLLCSSAKGCIKDDNEKRTLGKRAIDYFSTKYNIEKSKIKMIQNGLYGNEDHCWNDCGENEAKIEYNGKSYIIKYDLSTDTLGDNYQYKTIKNDLNKYLSEAFPYVSSIDIDMLDDDVYATPTKYTGNIEKYIKETRVRSKIDGGAYTKVAIWIETENIPLARELHNKYKKDLITKLNNLDISYHISFSTVKESSVCNAYYSYNVSDLNNYPQLEFWDNLDHNSENCQSAKRCVRKTIEFDGDEIICK